MSDMFELIKGWYVNGMWNLKRLQDALDRKRITPEEYEEILKAKTE